MTHLEKQIRTAQHRLWINRWMNNICLMFTIMSFAFAVVVLVQRLFDFPIPLMWIGVCCCGIVIVGSVVRTLIYRENSSVAAATLDQAAGLRERLSSGQYCISNQDPFAQAVVADAEHISASLSARQHIRLTTPHSLAMSAGSIVLAALMFLISPGLLTSTEATQITQQTDDLKRETVAVKRKMEAVKEITETTPALEEFKDKIEGLNKQVGGNLSKPGDLRHEAIKQIDSLTDAIKQKKKSVQYEKMNALSKMLRGLKTPQSADTPTQKLAKALSKADYKTAKEEVKSLKEQLATLKAEQDKEMVKKLSDQLEQLAKQMEKLASNEQMKKKLEQAGINKEDIDRLLENLSKKDLDQLKKQLAEKGMDQNKIEKLAKQLQQQKEAGGVAKQMAQAMKQGAKSAQAGQMSDAGQALSMAGGQLSELEQLEQEMAQMESSMASLQNTKNELSKPCGQCKGTGQKGNKPCVACKGSGGMGKMGQGRGGLAPEQHTDVDFKVERGKVQSGKGAIIGQFLFDGEQVKGEVSSSVAEVVSAGERDASDRINRDRIPRQYHKAVKNYFSNLKRSMGKETSDESESKSDVQDDKEKSSEHSSNNPDSDH